MDTKKKILVENILFDAIKTIHNVDNEDERNAYLKEYFTKFCKKNEISTEEAYELLEKMFKEKSDTTIFKYEHYSDGKLGKILFGNDKRTNFENTNRLEKSIEDR